jgi:hypothetical protein
VRQSVYSTAPSQYSTSFSGLVQAAVAGIAIEAGLAAQTYLF